MGNEVLGWWMHDLKETRDMIDQLLGAYDRHMAEAQGEHHWRSAKGSANGRRWTTCQDLMEQDQREEVYNIAKAESEKIYAMKSGEYPAEQMGSALEAISATFAMGKKLRSMYEAKGDENTDANYQRW